ncbi:EMILIN-3 [Clupea harengus]|uniref:EMILIN-3 n=1 Tax=Clupea harengus TaxID=7950 RepID=A0A6P8FDI9_CLUHA|nr:EMILIN-3 [Clupea harengus]
MMDTMAPRWAPISFTLGVLLVLSLVDAKGTFYGAPYRYNLYKGGVNPHHYNPVKPMTRHKNHCAYIVQRNITCTMQDGMATYVKAEYTTKCIWGQKCPVLMYRTFFKPKYKVGYKTVTELEWRCCPGYTGENCFDGPTSLPDAMLPPFKGALPRPAVKGYPRGQPKGSEPRPVPGGHLEPGKPYPVPGGQPDGRPQIPTGHLPSGGPNYGPKVGVSGERLDRMEDDLRRMAQGLDTLNGMVTGLEDRLRVSLRDDTNKLLTTLLSGAPPRLPPDSSVGFGVIPDGNLDGLSGGSSDGGGFLGYGELVGRVTEVKDELRVKSDMLDEIQGMVMGHDGQLRRLMEGATGRPLPGGAVNHRLLEDMLDARLAGVRAEILDGFEKRLLEMEGHCEDRIGQVRKQCEKEHLNGQEQMQQSLDGRETGLRKEMGHLQAQIQGLTLTDSCCGQVNSLSQRVLLLEESVKGLTESQRQLQVALSDQTIHIEAILETRLDDMEDRINTTTTERGPGGPDGWPPGLPTSLDGFNTLLDEKLKVLEERLFVAVEELSNATAPALLEGHVVPALETEIESVRRRVEADLDGVQKQLTDLELLCTSSCSPSSGGGEDGGRQTGMVTADDCEEVDKKVSGRLDSHDNQLEHFNRTLQGMLTRITEAEESGMVEGEITLLKINVNSVNRTLKGLRESVGVIAREVGHANSTWQHREERLANQVHGITQLVGRQASMLGAGERRLIQLKGELQGLRRRLAGELQGCRSTALGVQKEVLAVDSRVAQVEGQCSGMSDLADELERIRGELESHSDHFLARVNGTLTSHTQQLAQLKDGLQECRDKNGHTGQHGDQ